MPSGTEYLSYSGWGYTYPEIEVWTTQTKNFTYKNKFKWSLAKYKPGVLIRNRNKISLNPQLLTHR